MFLVVLTNAARSHWHAIFSKIIADFILLFFLLYFQLFLNNTFNKSVLKLGQTIVVELYYSLSNFGDKIIIWKFESNKLK